MVLVEILYNGHEAGDWCEVYTSMHDSPMRELAYSGHGDISANLLAQVLEKISEKCHYDCIKVVYNGEYSFEH